MWNSSYRTPTERCQKGKKLPTYLGRAKEKRKNRDKGIGMGPAPVGGSCEGGSFHTLGSPFTGGDGRWAGGKLQSHGGERSNGCGGQSGEVPAQRIGADQHSPAREACLLTCWGGRGWKLRLGLQSDRRERTGVGGLNTA